jgi:hypothetical protein
VYAYTVNRNGSCLNGVKSFSISHGLKLRRQTQLTDMVNCSNGVKSFTLLHGLKIRVHALSTLFTGYKTTYADAVLRTIRVSKLIFGLL